MLSKFNTNFKLIFIQFLPNCLYFNIVCQPNNVLYSSLFSFNRASTQVLDLASYIYSHT